MSEENSEKPAEENSVLDEAQEKAELQKYIDEMQEKMKSKISLREKNISRVPPAESYFVKLDSSLKKNTAFVKKLKQFTAAQIDTLLKDIRELNLTKYISEVCSALLEAKLKMTDIPAAITLCTQMHQIYGDFSQQFFEYWQKALSIKAGEKIQNMSKLRVDLRFYCDLISVGIFANKVNFMPKHQLFANISFVDRTSTFGCCSYKSHVSRQRGSCQSLNHTVVL